MRSALAELGFDVLLALASGFAFAAWALGLFVAPSLGTAIGLAVALLGAWMLAPESERAVAAGLGLVAVLLAGVAVPRRVLGSVGEMDVALAASAAILLLASLARRKLTGEPRAVDRA